MSCGQGWKASRGAKPRSSPDHQLGGLFRYDRTEGLVRGLRCVEGHRWIHGTEAKGKSYHENRGAELKWWASGRGVDGCQGRRDVRHGSEFG